MISNQLQKVFNMRNNEETDYVDRLQVLYDRYLEDTDGNDDSINEIFS